MKKSMENLKTSKLTGGRRHPLRSRKKYEINRFPNEALIGEQITITRRTRGKNLKTSVKTINSVNLVIGSKIKKVKILKVLDNATNTYHDIRANDFTINLPAGEYLNRFSMVFSTTSTLGSLSINRKA